MHIRKDPRKPENVTINSLRKSNYQKLHEMDPEIINQLRELKQLLKFVDELSRKPTKKDLDVMDNLLKVMKDDMVEHSKEVSKMGDLDQSDFSHNEADDINKVEDILMNIPDNLDKSMMKEDVKTKMLNDLKKLFMSIRGDHRNPKEVTVQDCIDLNVDSLGLEPLKTKELKFLRS